MTTAAIVPSSPAPLTASDTDALAAFGAFIGLHVADGDASPATLDTYRAGVGAFYAWCQSHGIAPALATAEDLVDYRRAMVADGLARDTIAARLASVKRFFEAAVWRGLRADNPAAGLKAPRNRTDRAERVKFLPPDGLPRLLSACPAGLIGTRDRALLALFGLQGVRVAELAGLDVAAVDLAETPARVRITGKGDKARTLYLVGADRAALEAWLKLRADVAAAGEAAVFVTTHPGHVDAGRRMTARSIRRRVDHYLTVTGLKREGVSCHSLRHSFGTWSAAAGVKVEAIGATLGHASITTTGVYVKVADRIKSNPAAALEKFYGLAS